MDMESFPTSSESVDIVIIGGGQAGLALGYHLARLHRDFVILDAGSRVGDGWRRRWDSLRLFTPAKYDGLPGMPFPGDPLAFPTKDEQADYLEAYATRFAIPVRTGIRVDRVRLDGDEFIVEAGHRRWRANSVVLATGGEQVPFVPAFADRIDESIVQLHSSAYRNPDQLRAGAALVVGVGNSGAEIALELSADRSVLLAGEPVGELPFRHGRNAARFALPLVRFAGTRVLTLATPMGRKAAAHFSGPPLIRTRLRDLAAAGVTRGAADHGRRRRPAVHRRRADARCGECDLVHRLPGGLRNPGSARRIGESTRSGARCRVERSRSLPARAAVLVRGRVRHPSRRRT